MVVRTALAVVLGGVAGTLANALAAVLVLHPALWTLALAPARYAVAILLMLAVPPLYRLLPGAWGVVAALIFLTAAPSLLAKLVLDTLTAWPVVLALNLVYALAAWPPTASLPALDRRRRARLALSPAGLRR